MLAAGIAQATVTVSGLTVAQRPGTKLVDISYDVASSETETVTVSLNMKNGTSVVNCPSVTGDVEPGVANGFDKKRVWDMGADWNGNVATLSCTVTADDGVITDVPILHYTLS